MWWITELTRELRKTIAEQFSDQEQAQSFRIEVMSLIQGIRSMQTWSWCPFLAKPYLPELRNQTRWGSAVYDYVMNHEESESFLSALTPLIEPILPSYKKKGKSV